MGRIRNKKVKYLAEQLLELFPNYFTKSFEENKRVLDRVAKFYSKKLRNQVAGYIVHLIKKREKLLGKES